MSEHSGLPDLDALAGQHLRYRDLVEAGETWARLRPDNRPRDPGSYAAMARLCRDVLDPVIDRFGPIRITYGHAGGSLTRAMPGGIYPSLDQHAGHERRRDGAWICGRLGQAVDFEVAGVPTSEVAAFIAGHLPFDRLYYYGRDRPLHVSAGPEECRETVVMRPVERRQIPRRLTAPAFRAWLASSAAF